MRTHTGEKPLKCVIGGISKPSSAQTLGWMRAWEPCRRFTKRARKPSDVTIFWLSQLHTLHGRLGGTINPTSWNSTWTGHKRKYYFCSKTEQMHCEDVNLNSNIEPVCPVCTNWSPALRQTTCTVKLRGWFLVLRCRDVLLCYTVSRLFQFFLLLDALHNVYSHIEES